MARIDWVKEVAVTPDGRCAISASSDNTLKVWDLPIGAITTEFTCDGAAQCCVLAGAEQILAGDAGGLSMAAELRHHERQARPNLFE
jgi:WD40 repeat protein